MRNVANINVHKCTTVSQLNELHIVYGENECAMMCTMVSASYCWFPMFAISFVTIFNSNLSQRQNTTQMTKNDSICFFFFFLSSMFLYSLFIYWWANSLPINLCVVLMYYGEKNFYTNININIANSYRVGFKIWHWQL